MNADLQAAPRDAVVALAASLLIDRTVEHLQVPHEGLWLLRMHEPVRGDHYFIGEVPVGQAAVRVHDAVLGSANGSAVLLHADRDHAVAAAVCLAVIQAGWPGAEAVQAVVAEGAAIRAQAARQRAAIRERTRVDFAELGQEGG